MWCATLGLNRITGVSKQQDWKAHHIEHQVGAYTDCPHGVGLAIVSIPYYKYIFRDGLDKFVRFAKEIWGIDPQGKTKEKQFNILRSPSDLLSLSNTIGKLFPFLAY
jgi:alcohol dehydrogenase YqhD (iron-dependent ADH family)